MTDSTEQMREARKVLAAPAAEQDAGYTIEQIADACVQAEISDGHFESLRIALAALTAPAAEPEQSTRLRGGVPTEAQIVAAARTLNKLSANSCNVDEADQWALYGNTFRAEAKAALTSALTAAPQAPAQQATPDALLEQIDDAALGGICQATSSGKHAFLVDIRKLVAATSSRLRKSSTDMTTNTEQLLREAASEALLTLDGIADTNPRDRADFENKDEWITWAKSRAKWAADKLRAPISRELLAERVLKQTLEQDAALTQPAQAGEVPLGAIVNGREHARRLVEHYAFKDPLDHMLEHCHDWIELMRCFECLADCSQRTTPPASQNPYRTTSSTRQEPTGTHVLLDALRKLSCLGNGDQPGNSDGNLIAQRALEAWASQEQADPQPMLDDDGRAMIVNSHHYTADNIRAVIAQLKAFANPQETTQADWENLDWRGYCNVLWRLMAGLACDLPVASQEQAQQPSVTDFPVPKGYALVDVESLEAWGKLDEVTAACIYPVTKGPQQ